MKKQTQNALSAYMTGCYSGQIGGIYFGGSKTDASSEGTDKKSSHTEIQLFVHKTGGPPEVDSLIPWKSGLLASNKTWSVIDRGDEFIPVWDIVLSSHKEDFEGVIDISNTLRESYEALTGIKVNRIHGEELFGLGKEITVFLEGLKEWKITTDPDKLVELVDFKRKLNNKTKSDQMWINLCLSNPALQNFLEQMVLLLKKDPVASDISHMKRLLHSLLDPHIYAVRHFSSSSTIMQWIFQVENEQPQAPSITELADFISILQQMKTSIKDTEFKPAVSAAAVEKGKVKICSDLSLAFSSLLKALRESSQENLALLMLSIAQSAGYSVKNNVFQCHLDLPEIDFMLREMPKAHGKYLALCEKDAYRAQAYLILTGLRISVDHKDVPSDEKNKRLAFMTDHMKNLLTNETAFVLTKHNTCNNWNLLERDLDHLIGGNYEATNNDQQKENILRELMRIFLESNQSGNLECKDVSSNQDKTWRNNLNNEFLNLIKRLQLEQYYPNKMKMSDFHLIQKTSLFDNHPSTDQELPCYFLEKILMLDYQARYVAYKDETSLQQGEANISDASEHLDDLDYIFEDAGEGCHEVIPSIQKSIHPMDVQMAIFYCADDFMRQYIAMKLSFCQFALPLLVPIPCTSQIELPLWSFCQVHKQWQEKGSKCADKLIYQVATPVVSFIRFSTSSSSKSQILNNLLSKHKHNIFFHRHCKGSDNNCLLMKGVVEIAWYCPGGKENDMFDTCIAFTNLHGDAKEHKQQVDFLQEIASVTVILLSERDLNGDSQTFLKELLKSPKPFIFLCADKEQIGTNRHAKRVKIAVKNRNEAALVEELAQEIKSALNISNACHSLEMCAVVARRHGFFIDEDKEACKTGKAMAENIVNILKDEQKRGKSTLLPLQGSLWHMWCKKDREQNHLQYHENIGLEQQISQINSAKQSIKQDQLNQAFPLNDLMKSLLTHLYSSSHNTKIYFLEWLKTFMASQSYDHLAVLQEKYHGVWTLTPFGENSDLHCKLEEISKEISESTFGLEHLLREVAQLYEVLDVLPHENQVVQFLPQIAADLIVSGYPMELMDGDASHVPIKWISAIFDTLVEKLGDKEVFVLCVLGSQSTGKSTLLNAMFGLQFRVSPGRCTKGAFMQLVKVADELRPKLNFDFVLVVDTEGLQPPELENRAIRSHDNELATFVIGLGNKTIINTFGENPSEMQDVLQIAVQAFLRMKKVNLSPSCLFVHQNAGEITTEEKNRESRRRLQHNLDEMTVTAAKQESCDVSCFSEVIQFDVNSHIYYFPHLWEGELPMAPPNPSYSQKVQELKSKIFLDGEYKSRDLLKLSELKTHIQNLWQALLNETFVFSFRNTLEIAAYSRLEDKYSKWTWQLRSFMLDYSHKLTIQIQNGKVHGIDRSFLEESIRNTYEDVKKDLEKYFREDKYSDLIIQWKENITIKLDFVLQDLINKTYQNCEKNISLKKRRRRYEQRKSVYDAELLKKSKKVAQHCRDQELNESELREYFNGMWKEWIAELSLPASHIKTLNIRADVEHFLSEHFRREHDITNRIKKSSKWTSFPGEAFYVILFKMLKAYFFDEMSPSLLRILTRQLEILIDKYIKMKEEEIMNYSSSYFHEIVKIINDNIHSFEEKTHLKATSSYRVDISLYLCQVAARKFAELYEIFQKKKDPIIYLNSKKEDFFKSFAIYFQGAKSATTFADFLCSSLKLTIRNAIYEKTATDIVNEMMSEDPAFNGNRKNLETYLLNHLAEKENFDKYMDYIYNPSYSIAEFIRQRVNNYCLDKRNPQLKKFLHSNLNVFSDLILCAISDSTRIVEDEGGSVSLWLDEFCSRIGDYLYLPRHTLSNIEHQEVISVKLIKEAVSDSLVPVLDDLKRTFSETDLDPFFAKPHEILFDQLRGCMKQCPFCKAICTNTIPNHDGEHSTYSHRPQAVTGIQWEGTNHFVTDICFSIVASDCTFTCNGKKIPCKNYRKAGSDYAEWNIKPSSCKQDYWKWFVCHFRNELEDVHQGVFEGKGTIPHDWENISKRDIVHQMKKQLCKTPYRL
ncbi:interferon-induced very large GTPase 1-like [Heteronotia binoei]|uniref:interferon-induced very large GTPase 1-like n=1 Tax=Heteronotia binoei TaxID=13085 RepID=UPI002931B9F8|nr:interferon-induced very large GTPase 1-like [Heteronotia binoei]